MLLIALAGVAHCGAGALLQDGKLVMTLVWASAGTMGPGFTSSVWVFLLISEVSPDNGGWIPRTSVLWDIK